MYEFSIRLEVYIFINDIITRGSSQINEANCSVYKKNGPYTHYSYTRLSYKGVVNSLWYISSLLVVLRGTDSDRYQHSSNTYQRRSQIVVFVAAYFIAICIRIKHWVHTKSTVILQGMYTIPLIKQGNNHFHCFNFHCVAFNNLISSSS